MLPRQISEIFFVSLNCGDNVQIFFFLKIENNCLKVLLVAVSEMCKSGFCPVWN